MAKKKKKAVSKPRAIPANFDPGRFRMAEEGVTPPESPEKIKIRQQFESEFSIVDEALNKYESDLNALLAQLEADADAAELAVAEAEKYAAEAAKFEEEGDIAMEAGDTAFLEAFYGDPNSLFSGLGSYTKNLASKGMFGGNAALTAAFSALSAVGVEGLLSVMEQIRTAYPDISAEDALTLLKFDKRYNEPYLQRFSGNRKRMAAGLAPLDDQTYLANEAAYSKIFNAYGLKQFDNRERYANFIGSDIAPDEVAERVQLVYNRVNNAMPQVSKALLQFYPELTTQDLMAYSLDPATQLPAIQRKVQAAEIGGAALAQNLSTSLNAATFTGQQAAPFSNVTRGTIGVETMMKGGADAETAAKASAYVAEVLPTAEKLSSIYSQGYQQYGQVQAEQEAYLNSVDARRRREALRAREVAEFQGESGMLKSQRRAVGGLI